MEERNQRIEALLARYFEARTTAVEECELREFFSGDREIPRELLYARTMFRGLEALAGVKAVPEPARENDSLRKTAAQMRPAMEQRDGLRLRIWAGAAAVVAAAGVFLLVNYFNRPYCYIDGVPVRDAETAMQTTVYFEDLQKLDKPIETLDRIMQQIQKEKI